MVYRTMPRCGDVLPRKSNIMRTSGCGLRCCISQGGDAFLRLIQRQAIAVQRLVHGLDGGDTRRGEAAPAQPFVVHGTRLGRLPLAHHEWRLVGKQQRAHGRHAMRADADELVQPR
jgi:hypothetical protein